MEMKNTKTSYKGFRVVVRIMGHFWKSKAFKDTAKGVLAAIAVIALATGIYLAASGNIGQPVTDVAEGSDSDVARDVYNYRFEPLLSKSAETEGAETQMDSAYPGQGGGLSSGEDTDDPVYALALSKNSPDSSSASARVTFSKKAGAYAEPFRLMMTAPVGWTICYTLDGTEPTPASIPYEDGVEISDADSQPNMLATEENIAAMTPTEFYGIYVPDPEQTAKATVVKAAAFSPDGASTPVTTATYFCGKSIAQRYRGAAVISITTSPENLLDYNTGIFATGGAYRDWVANDPYAPTAIANNESWVARGNFMSEGREWERPAYVEIFDGTDELSAAAACGIRVKGGGSRIFSQKSLNVYMRDEYGSKRLEYPLFDSVSAFGEYSALDSYKSFTVRNGGNDSEAIKFRDAYLQSMLGGLSFGVQVQRPAIVFIDGEYWGVYNLSEKWGSKMIAALYGVDDDDVVSYKGDQLDEGNESDSALYDELLEYAHKDMSDPEVWAAFNDIVDVQSFSDYFAAEIFIGNVDWYPERNYQIWRTRTKGDTTYGDGKWRWLMYDTEYSSGLYPTSTYDKGTSVEFDHFARAVEYHPLFRSALYNDEFKKIFMESLETVAHSNFELGRAMSRLDEFENAYRPLMDDTWARFGTSPEIFDKNIAALRDFISNRANYILPMVEADLSDYVNFVERRTRQMAGGVLPGEAQVAEEQHQEELAVEYHALAASDVGVEQQEPDDAEVNGFELEPEPEVTEASPEQDEILEISPPSEELAEEPVLDDAGLQIDDGGAEAPLVET